ncbi:MAG: cytochrome P460 family protein [Prosthecobacter sp.]|uniref:cytochrome P460 family protein n=1 Tax=Prosthecobacter sp. TaxID=1965333 RepID=UPI0039016BFB
MAIFILVGLALVHAGESKRIDDEEIALLLKFKTGLTNTTPQPVKLADPQAILCGLPLNRDIHANAWARFLVSTKALKEWQAQARDYSQGVVLAKTKYADAKGETTLLHTVMVKREPGYNPEGGDWEYVLTDTNGGVQVRGKLTSCMECHSRYKDTNCVAPITALTETTK